MNEFEKEEHKDIWAMCVFCHICPAGCCVKIIK